MAKGYGNEVGANARQGSYPATVRMRTGERELQGPYIPTS